MAKLPGMTEGSSLIEDFPFLPDLGPLRSNLSYSDLYETSNLPVLSGHSPINRDATLSKVADRTVIKDQGKQNTLGYSAYDFNQETN